MSALQVEETYLPEDGEQVAKVYDLLVAKARQREVEQTPKYLLVGANPSDRVELPEELFRILIQAVDALRSGQAVTVAPHSVTLTTQQAADLLGISRPTLVHFLEQGLIPFERLGSHRRLKLRDVLEFREHRRKEQYAALDAIFAEDDLENSELVAIAKEARRAVGSGYRRNRG